MAEPGGLVLKDDDGNLYFISNDVLEVSKLEGEQLVRATELLEAGSPEVEGFGWGWLTGGGLSGPKPTPPLWFYASENLAPDPPGRRSTFT